MTETSQSLRDDIAFMRALADEGMRPPLVAGPHMISAGIIWGGACLAAWILGRFGGAKQDVQNYPFFVAAVLFFIVMAFLAGRTRRMPGAKSPANRAAGMAWAGSGWGIFCLAICASIVSWRTHNALPVALMPSGILILYGAAWTVTAAMIRDRFLWWVALGSYASAALIAALISTPDVYLAFTLVLVAVALIPGIVLLRREPKLVV